MKEKVFIRTWGCTLNQTDSDIMYALLKEKGYTIVNKENNADVVVLNTCTVKGATENKIIAKLQTLYKKRVMVVLAGCLSINPKKIRKIAPNIPIIGTGAVKFIDRAVEHALNRKTQTFRTFEHKFDLPRRVTSPIARIPIQEGCIGNCTFCQTKLARPFLMSWPIEKVKKMVKTAVENKAKEIQLTGMDCGAYGIDIKTNLAALLEKIVKIKGKFKIRLGMINPNHASRMQKELIRIMKNKKMFKFLHVPVQTGSEKICKQMNRVHTVKDFEDVVKKFRESIKNITIATDIIVGYPEESEEDFRLTLNMLKKIRPDVVNLSKFTPRPETKAAELKMLDSKIVKKRSSEANLLIKKIATENAQKFIGKKINVLVLECGKNKQMKARAENYKQVVVKGTSELLGKEINVLITSGNHTSLFSK